MPGLLLTKAVAFARATELAARGPAFGPNPRVGAVLVASDGTVLGEGWHKGAGTPHAEVAAIADAVARGSRVAGSTAYVTLEPCAHTGRTGPCTQALAAAGVAKVRYAVADPNPAAAGGGEALRGQGIDAQLDEFAPAAELNARWLVAVRRGRPYVIAKWAQTLDGKIAAKDGTSFWITGEAARDHAHAVRAEVDAIVVGTATIRIDDPLLSARPGGGDAEHQPLRVVMGRSDTAGARVWRDDNAIAFASHDPADVLQTLDERDVRTVLIEGGATIQTAFLAAGLVDELNVYVAPALLGSGTSAVGDVGIATMAEVLRASDVRTVSLGPDTLFMARLGPDSA